MLKKKNKKRDILQKRGDGNQESQRLDYSLHLYGRDGYNTIRNITMLTAGRDTQMQNQV